MSQGGVGSREPSPPLGWSPQRGKEGGRRGPRQGCRRGGPEARAFTRVSWCHRAPAAPRTGGHYPGDARETHVSSPQRPLLGESGRLCRAALPAARGGRRVCRPGNNGNIWAAPRSFDKGQARAHPWTSRPRPCSRQAGHRKERLYMLFHLLVFIFQTSFTEK